jgi:HlyD family secretion protein
VLRAAGLILLGLALGVGVAFGYYAVYGPVRPNQANRPGNKVRNPPKGQGTLEARNGPVLIASPLIGFLVKTVAVKEGDLVSRNDLLVEIDALAATEEVRIAEAQKNDATERLQNEREIAQLRVDAADLAVKQATDAKQLELDTQKKRIEVAELKVKQADSDLRRLEALQSGVDPIVSAQQVDQQRVLKELAIAERDATSVGLTRLEQTLDFQMQKASSEQKGAASALAIAQRSKAVETLESQVALAKLKLGQTKVTAPLSGTVINVAVHEGEVVTNQPLLQIADLTDMICLAEVDVSEVPQLKENGEALIKSRAFHGQTIKGRIERIGNLAGSAMLRPLDPRQAVDRSVTHVTIRINAAEVMKAMGGDQKTVGAALVGLQVDVEFTVSGQGTE